jgi:flagellar motor protein MotB
MLKTIHSYLLTSFLFLLIAAGCVPKQGITKARNDLTTVNQQLKQHDAGLAALEKERKKKEQLNEIDDTASQRIKKFIDKTHQQLDTLVRNNTVLIGETALEKEDWDRLRKALSFSRKTSKIIGEKIEFLNELIDQNLVLRIDQDVVFGPGKYEVEPSVANALGRIFEPAAKEIDYLVKKYPDFPLSLVITAKGYSDATQIAEGSGLYKELSVARAEAVIRLFKNYTVNRSKTGGNIRNILYLHEGKGEALPDPKISNYQVNDPRRRVVLLFWSIFPD